MTIKTEKSNISPKAFLKARRPERFSDSITQDIGRLDRAVLEHQLSTLNKRNKELAFEDFSKQICEKTICPNLLEQTGPVAGGDGKVDTQTYPVSEQIKTLWYIGVNDSVDKDRWAFAISTQENWKEKCRKDVRKIKSTGRDYKKAFFITNQYAKANQRSELEDALTKETGIDVRTLDISWILDQVFNNGYEQLAIDTLSIDIDWRREVKVGANDYSKTCRIEELNDLIKNKIKPDKILPHQLDWILEIAVLSKELEKPQIESRGLFDRAVNAVEKFGTSYHRFNTHYQYAWASYWWYEDIKIFEEQMRECFNIAKDINQSSQWGDVVTLLGLHSTYSRSCKEKVDVDIDSLRCEVRDFLSDMALQDERPSNSLMARVNIELIILHTIDNIEQASPIFLSLLSIVKESESLVGFPFLEIYDLVTELDEYFCDLESYESLLDYLTEQTSHREGEKKESLLWLKRGARRLDSKEPYQAIKLIGKSLAGLYKEEAKEDLYTALNLISEAYRKVGLIWAARANLLLAASIITDDWWRSGDLVPAQVYSYLRLATIELQLGRLNYAMTWWKFACIIDANINDKVISKRKVQEFDAFLSQCILNAKFKELISLVKLPDFLDTYQLYVSRSMLLYVLGHEEIVIKEYELVIDQDYIDYLKLVRDVDFGVTTPDIKILGGRYIQLKSIVLGCELNISFPFRSPIVEFSETVLSVIEGFFSTSLIDKVMILESRVDIEVTADDDEEIGITHEVDNTGSIIKFDILCSSFTPEKLNIAGQGIIHRWLRDFVIEVFAHLMRPINTEKTLASMVGDDRAFERSVSFGACLTSQNNILGNNAVNDIKELLADGELKKYDLLRTETWDKEFPKEVQEVRQYTDLKPGIGKPPESIMNYESLTHRDISIQDLIKTRLWDKTVWRGVGYAMHSDGTPELILLYENEQSAAAIFDDLVNQVGHNDEANRLRISIIRHIDKDFPAHYIVMISENMAFSDNRIAQVVARINTMTPPNKLSIEGFLKAYKKRGCYLLNYAVIQGKHMLPLPGNRKVIRKCNINVMEAKDISQNDIEAIALQKGDKPFIPDD